MTQQHSPLPWTRRMATTDTWFIDGADGKTIVLVGRNELVHETPEPGVRVMRDVLKPHADANAALFFAAPKLLSSLQGLLARYMRLAASGDCGFWDAETEAEVIAARAAITEATTVIDGAEEAKAEQARRTAELDRLCGPTPPPAPGAS